MTKADLVQSVQKNTQLTKEQSGAAVDSVVDAIVQSLKSGEGLSLKGFGSFVVQTRPARQGHNPKTKEKIEIPEKKIVKFKVSPEVKKEIN